MKKKKIQITIITIALGIVCAAVILELTNKINLIDISENSSVLQQTPTTGDSSSAAATSDKGTPNNVSEQTSESDKLTNVSDKPDAVYKPSGNFVSNHKPNLSGSPAPNVLQSSCSTSPGASCTIVFTQGQVTKQLPSQITDKGGSAFWSWKLQDIELTSGSWKVMAIASMNSSSEITEDPILLEVSP